MNNDETIIRIAIESDGEIDINAVADVIGSKAGALLAEVIKSVSFAVVQAEQTDIDLRIVKTDGYNSAEYSIMIMNVSARMNIVPGDNT